ncbi:hypothetical protein PV325_011572 [Microctonus aethiopoides]|nr:hypothetical protein PV325_011572 [Microctonus aethiopoides]
MFFDREFKNIKDPFIDGQYKLNRIDASILGIWPEQSLFWRIFLPVLHTTFMITIIIPEIRRFIQVLDDLDLFMACVPSFIIIFAAGLKLYTVSLNNKAFTKAISKMREDWKRFDNPFTGHVMYKYAAIGYKGTFIYQALLYGGVFMFITLPVMPAILDIIIPLNESRNRPPLFETDYGVNPNDYFVVIVFHAFICTMQLIHTFSTVDSLVFIMVEHCCGLFEIINVILNQFNDETKNYTENEECKIICYAVDVHRRAIDFATFIESTFSNMYGVIVLANMLAISMTGVMIVVEMNQKDWGSVVRFSVYCVGTMFHLYANSVPGQQLYDHSEAAYNTVYNCNWSMLSIGAKKLIGFMLVRCANPCKIAAAGFYVMNMENFGSVIQTSMSYLTVLTSMR